MVDIGIPLMVLVLSSAQLGRLLGQARNRPAMKWLLLGMNIAALLLALAVLADFRLRAPVPEFVPILAALIGVVMCCVGVYLQSRMPLSGGS